MGNNTKSRIFFSIKIMTVLVALLWGILLLSEVLPLKNYGISPRSVSGIPGIFLSPFLHVGVSHLAANSISLFILGIIFINMEFKRGFDVILYMIILSGLGTWLIGRSGSVHIGASGLIYGLIGFLLFLGIFTKKFKTIFISLIVFFLYGGAIWGVLPGKVAVSWEAHLCGFLSGILLAKIVSKNSKNYSN